MTSFVVTVQRTVPTRVLSFLQMSFCDIIHTAICIIIVAPVVSFRGLSVKAVLSFAASCLEQSNLKVINAFVREFNRSKFESYCRAAE